MADILRPTKTAISRQTSSARSSRLLCPNLLVRPITPRTAQGHFVYQKAAKTKETTTQHWNFGEVVTAKPENPPPSHILNILYICIYPISAHHIKKHDQQRVNHRVKFAVTLTLVTVADPASPLP